MLVWLMGDTRLIREDAKLYFRKANKEEEDDEGEDWKDEKSDDSETDLEEVDYEQVLQHIDNFLPVKELAGRPVGPSRSGALSCVRPKVPARKVPTS